MIEINYHQKCWYSTDLQIFDDFFVTVDLPMMREFFNYGILIDSQLQLSEQPVDAAHMLGNYAQSFYINLLVNCN